ncbi:MarR family winged helix-turn-helix transcriptional regulator [Laceyella putida]|uniref:MarR family winged helix-turn-helix transcriptional regulator n=1 Tax=Laceyella putida TaxID=110101 RepID=A0ABW2RPI2_9BACL
MSDRLEMILELEQSFRHIIRQMRKDLADIWEEKINGAEFNVLKSLQDKSPQIVTALAQEFDCSVSHITHVADHLEKKNLAYRKRSQLDKRVVELHISEQGQHLIEELSRKKSEYFRAKFEHLATDEIATLLNLLHKINWD